MPSRPLQDILQQSQSPVRSAKIVVKSGEEYKSVLMFTLGNDGSLILNSGAYFLGGNWRWGFFDVPPGRVGKVNVPIVEESAATRLSGHGPKITYHLSGWMTTKLEGHISDQGIPRVQANPLLEVSGHLFTIMAKGFNSFKTANLARSAYAHIPVSAGEELASLKIVGYLGKLEDLVGGAMANGDDPSSVGTIIEEVDGFRTENVFFRIDRSDGEERWLHLQFWPNFPYNEGSDQPSFSMLTGWKKEEISDPGRTARCLGLLAGQ